MGNISSPAIDVKVEFLPSPDVQVRDAVRRVLDQRGKQYTPAPGRSQIQAKMADAVKETICRFRPGKPVDGQNFAENMLIAKFTRALEQAWNGTYSGDNTLDFGGYSACLAALVKGEDHPAKVVK